MLTSKQVEAQIFAMEKRKKCAKQLTAAWYAIDGKIKKLHKLLDETKKFEHLAK